MNFDFLVFPSPKCTYNKKKLGDELIFIPKYNKVQILEQKRPMTQANSPFYFSKQAISPFSKIVSMAKLTHSKKTKTTNFFSPKTSIDSIFQSPRKINVKIEMPNNNLQKMNLKEEEDAPTTPLLSYHDFIEEKTRLHQESKKLFKKPPRLQELSLNEERNSFFIKSGSDFEEGIDNGLTSPKKILNYNFKAPQANNLIKLNSLKDFTSRYNSRAQVFDITSLKNHNKTVKTIEVEKVDRFIPCLFLDPGNPSDKIMIFFHGNAEDIFQAYELLSCIESYLKVIFFVFLKYN